MGHVLTRLRLTPPPPPGDYVQSSGTCRLWLPRMYAQGSTRVAAQGVVRGGSGRLVGVSTLDEGGGGGGGTPVFASDWGAALGNTDNAVRDGGKWTSSNNIANPTADRVTVVTASGLDFPAGMDNVLAIRYENSTDTFCGISGSNLWTLPSVGGSLYTRCYMRHDISGTHSHIQHPSQFCSAAGTCCPQGWWLMNKGSTFQFWLGVSQGVDQHEWEVTLNREQTYRIEERYERTATNTFILHAKIYDSSNNLVFDNADFECETHGYAHSLADLIETVVTDMACYRNRILVNQGVGFFGSGSDDPAHNRIYWGGFAVSHESWLGPYVPGEAD